MSLFERPLTQRLVLIFLLLWLTALYSLRTNLLGSDLGRHITNGRVILESGSVFSSNFYSFTHPDFFVPNHHWLFGVFAYLVYEAGGFVLLSLFGVGISMLAVGLLLWWVLKKERTNLTAILFALWVLLPIFAHRSEIRPEAFSLLFVTVLILVLRKWMVSPQSRRFPFQLLWLIPLFAMWVNLHIFFIFGGLVLASAGAALLVQKQWRRFRQLVVIGVGSLAATLLNPVGLTGLIYPFRIFDNYAYRIAENQSVWFFLNYQTGHWYYQYLAVALVVVLGLAVFLAGRRFRAGKRVDLYPTVLVLGFGVMTLSMTRYESLFALSALFWFGTHGWLDLRQWLAPRIRSLPNTVWLALASTLIFSWLIFMLATLTVIPFGPQYGFGLMPNNRASGEFFRSIDTRGQLFNNYDVGGYLIFELFPVRSVFVDNRPEAYPGIFLSDVLIAAQLDDEIWKQVEEEYDIGSIFFYRHDMTEHGQAFMIARLKDEEWVPVFVDDYALIFVDTRPEHQKIIDQYALPNDKFVYE